MTEPIKVEVTSVDPVAVEAVAVALTPVKPTAPDQRVQQQQTDPSIPAQTTFQEDLTTAGQRNVNLIWETTQGRIALYVILGTLVVDGLTVLLSLILGKDLTAAQGLSLGFINSLATGVVSFYFSRTNHAAIGGVGSKPNDEYKGR